MAWRLGLLGHPLGHSLSPAIHEAALAACGLTGEYVLYEVDAPALADAVERLRRGERDGLNVTIPHKVAVVHAVDGLAGAAAALGAVNTLVRDGGRVVGHNTDVGGLVRAVREAFSLGDLRGEPVAIVGAGGAARAAALAAAQLGAGVVRIANRTPDRARDLVLALVGAGLRVELAPDFVAAARGAALLLQASSLGLGLAATAAAWATAMLTIEPVIAALAPDAKVFDLVYRPEVTPWCAAAHASGRRAASGLGMLVHQAADAFTLWTGHTPPRAPLLAAAQAALARSATVLP